MLTIDKKTITNEEWRTLNITYPKSGFSCSKDIFVFRHSRFSGGKQFCASKSPIS